MNVYCNRCICFTWRYRYIPTYCTISSAIVCLSVCRRCSGGSEKERIQTDRKCDESSGVQDYGGLQGNTARPPWTSGLLALWKPTGNPWKTASRSRQRGPSGSKMSMGEPNPDKTDDSRQRKKSVLESKDCRILIHPQNLTHRKIPEPLHH
ncbi:hypothetical protein BO82DRAFT_191660 [Aspergillus uvarum CBS 121591]|uniref:Uncharacterized protein n=1 Tax=Aspergillus uvarum CBS 121591 TaxID=1448315 RepID=A0A319BXE4_9EURO|nr:hypothetical protein BO82DRAFT_191660 [Aspergillus uvarum CBS 121591]PYH76921.1 hypothetical protein BO82DRAFT_191660 [Aspergillus uvarum CBS 121591]